MWYSTVVNYKGFQILIVHIRMVHKIELNTNC